MTTKLILLTYMRSGSSFAGEIFNNHPEVFYVYEPLWATEQYYKNGQPIMYLDKKPG